ncbi:MAG: hypothetical protein JWN48_4372 [Myxococcaceae bacterium]|nr:hypothetical protein [Myxococcaceae bacterium]
MSRALAYGVGLGFLALVAAPGFGSPDDDSYPLSTYPMFARARGKPWLDFVEGLDAKGEAVHLEPRLVASDEVMQAAASVRRAVAGGPLTLAPFCEDIAARVARSPAHTEVLAVRIVGARFDPLRYFVEGPTPEERLEHFRCPVARPR